MSTDCTTPARLILGEGVEPSTGLCPRRSRRRAFLHLRHPSPKEPIPGEGLEPSSPVPKTGVLPLDDPGRKRTRHDSNVRPQAPQACALNPSELRVRRRRRCDSNAQGQRLPGGLAGRCTTVCASPPKSTKEGAGVEPAEAFAPTVFGTARHARAQPSASGRDARTRTGIGGFGIRKSGL